MPHVRSPPPLHRQVEPLNTSPRIVQVEPMPDWIRALYERVFADASLTVEWAGAVPDGELPALVSGATVLVTGKRRINADLLAAAGPGLEGVVVVGRAPWAVDREAAAEARVQVVVVPHTGAIAVAEHAMALMLGVYRHVAVGHQGTITAAYQDLGVEPILTDERTIAFNWLKLDGVDQLYGKTLGLVGLGDIGLEVARRALAFDMNVLYTKRSPLPPAHEALAGVQWASLKTLLADSDIVSLHAPHTPATAGMIGREALGRMKSTAVLINTSRGGLVDERALVSALRSRSLGGAGLDVFVHEPLPADHPLLALDNVLLSPHLGGGTGGGQRGVANKVGSAIRGLLRGTGR